MSSVEYILRALAVLLGVFSGLTGASYWIVGLAPGPSKPLKQTSLGALCVTVAIFLLVFAFTGSLAC